MMISIDNEHRVYKLFTDEDSIDSQVVKHQVGVAIQEGVKYRFKDNGSMILSATELRQIANRLDELSEVLYEVSA